MVTVLYNVYTRKAEDMLPSVLLLIVYMYTRTCVCTCAHVLKESMFSLLGIVR